MVSVTHLWSRRCHDRLPHRAASRPWRRSPIATTL